MLKHVSLFTEMLRQYHSDYYIKQQDIIAFFWIYEQIYC